MMGGVGRMKRQSLLVLIDSLFCLLGFLLGDFWWQLRVLCCVCIGGVFILFHLGWERIRVSRPRSVLSGRHAINMGRGQKTQDWERKEHICEKRKIMITMTSLECFHFLVLSFCFLALIYIYHLVPFP